jgi:general secretion pathway protein E
VLSTLHTNDAVGAVSRMQDLGVPPFLLSSTLLGVMAQRLLRRLCPHCSTPVQLTAEQMSALKAPFPLMEGGVHPMHGPGCVRCRTTGYFGRTGVFELFSASNEVRDLINRKAGVDELVGAARKVGLRTLREAAVRKLAMGQTSYEEVLRMTTAGH